ncbi:MAG: D-2-hydroxyacid dehydrogenase, partial [Pseudomonadota bacterium]
MKRPNVVLHTNAADMGLEVLARTHPDLKPAVCRDFAGLQECLATNEPEVIFTSNFLNEPFPQGTLFGVETVKWVQNSGSGINHLMPWDPAKVTVTNSAGVAAEAMAQYGIGMMLHYGLDVPGLQADQTARTWASRRIG